MPRRKSRENVATPAGPRRTVAREDGGGSKGSMGGAAGKRAPARERAAASSRAGRTAATRKGRGAGNDGVAKTAVLVAGMHRSGTSALARVLNFMGCALPGTLLEPNFANEAGYWESEPVVRLNDDILASAGSAWDDWQAFDPAWYASPIAGEFRERALEVLEGEYGRGRLFVLKDPRMCRMLPFWIEAARSFGADPLVVVPVRNPLDVAASLEARDGIDPSVGYLMWLRNVLDAEAASREVRRGWVRYERLLSDPLPSVDRLGVDLGVSWPRRSSIDAELETREFLSPGLRHHRSEDADLAAGPMLSRWAAASFEILDRWARGRVRKADTPALNRIRSVLDEAAPVFGRVVSMGRKNLAERDGRIEELNRTVVERDGRVEEFARSLSERDGRIEALDRAVAERAGRVDELARAATERDKLVDGLNQAVTERDWWIEGLSRGVTERDGRIEGLNLTLAERDGRIDGLNETLADRDERIEGLNRALAERDGRVEKLVRAATGRDEQVEELVRTVAERDGRVEELARAVAGHDGQVEALNRTVAERDGRVEELVRTVAERDGRVEELVRTVAERDGRVEELVRTVAERDGRIEELAGAVAERGGRIEELTRMGAERDGRFEVLTRAVAERDGRIEELARAAAERDGQVEALTRAVVERDGRVEELTHAVTERDGRVEELVRAVAERDGQVEELARTMAERVERVEELARAVAERDGRVEELARAVAERDGQVEKLLRTVAERGGRIEELARAVAERDGRVEELARTVAERDERIEALAGTVAEREERVEELARVSAEREERVEALSRTVAERDGRAAELAQAVADRDGRVKVVEQALAKRNHDLAEIYDSNSWQITAPLRFLRRAPGMLVRKMHAGLSRTALWLYRRSPLPPAVKQRIRKRLPGFAWRLFSYPLSGPKPVAREYYAVSRGELADHAIAAGKDGDRFPILFDPAFYLDSNDDVRSAGVDPLEHYLEWGAAEGRMPLGDIRADALHPLVEYIHRAGTTGDEDDALDVAFYRMAYPDIAHLDAHEHYERYGRGEGRARSVRALLSTRGGESREVPLDFDPDEYADLYPWELEALRVTPLTLLLHYLDFGRWQGKPYRRHAFRASATPSRTSPRKAPATSPPAGTPPLCVLAHVYYAELWDELSGYLGNLPEGRFALYVNLVDTTLSHALVSRVRDRFPFSRIYISENRGRDIGGFVRLLKNVRIDDYRIYGLFHTKMSPYFQKYGASVVRDGKTVTPDGGKIWRERIFTALMGTRERAAENVDLMLEDETIGEMAAASCRRQEMGENREKYHILLDRLDIGAGARDVEFASGTMGFLRADVLRRVFEGIRDLPFEKGDGQSMKYHMDGQWGHAVERIIGNVVRDMGYRFEWR